MDEIERELLKVEAMADVLVTAPAVEFGKNTLTSMAVIIQEACGKIREHVKRGLKQKG